MNVLKSFSLSESQFPFFREYIYLPFVGRGAGVVDTTEETVIVTEEITVESACEIEDFVCITGEVVSRVVNSADRDSVVIAEIEMLLNFVNVVDLYIANIS